MDVRLYAKTKTGCAKTKTRWDNILDEYSSFGDKNWYCDASVLVYWSLNRNLGFKSFKMSVKLYKKLLLKFMVQKHSALIRQWCQMLQLSERLASLGSHGGAIEDTTPPETPRKSQHYYSIERFKGCPDLNIFLVGMRSDHTAAFEAFFSLFLSRVHPWVAESGGGGEGCMRGEVKEF